MPTQPRFLLCDLMRPVIRILPRGGIRLLGLCGGGQQAEGWEHAPRRYRTFRDCDLQAIVTVDLADWAERWHYYLGRYHDPVNQQLIRACLSTGDTYVDVGANLGMHSLFASRAVGATGQVIAFEPNPETFRRLQAHLVDNAIANCQAHNVGLSDRSEELVLSGSDCNKGGFTFRTVEEKEQSFRVRVERGDEMLRRHRLHGTTLIKIDVEGFEHRVLQGLGSVLDRPRTLLSMELSDAWLRETGASAGGVYELLRQKDFRIYRPSTDWRGCLNIEESREPLTAATVYDVFCCRLADLPDSLRKTGRSCK